MPHPAVAALAAQRAFAAVAALGLLILLLVSPLHAQEGGRLEQVQVGPFLVTGDWTEAKGGVTGKGTIEAPWGGTIKLTATVDGETSVGKWQARFTHPVLGNVAVASGRATPAGLEFQQKVAVGAGAVLFDFVLTPTDLAGKGEGTLRLGKVSLGKVGLLFAGNKIEATSNAEARLPGVKAPVNMTLAFDGRTVTATGVAKVQLGPYTFTATANVDAKGTVTLTASQPQTIPGLGAAHLTLNYANGKLSAAGTQTVTLGTYSFTQTQIGIDSTGKLTVSAQQSQTIPGIGATQMSLAYANGVVSATGTRTITLGSYAFDNTTITLSSNGSVSLAKQASLNLPVVGTTQMSLSYDNGVLSATATRSVTLSGIGFSSVAISLDSSGNLSMARQQDVALPGIGSTQMTLVYGNGALYATGSRTISLGQFAFNNSAIRLDSSGITITNQQSVTIPGLGATQMSLAYVNGKVTASASRSISIGGRNFDNAAISLDSTGNLAVAAQQSFDFPGLGSTQMTLVYANGAVSASGTRTVSLGRFGFDNATFLLDATGLHVSKTVNLSLPAVGSTQMSLAYNNGVISATGTRTLTLFGYGFDNAAISLDSTGNVAVAAQRNINLAGLGSTQLTLAIGNDTLYATGTRDVQLGQYLFSSAAVRLDSSGISVTKTASVNIPGLGATQMSLSFVNGVVTATGTQTVSLGGYAFSDTAVTISNTGLPAISKAQGVNIPGIGNVNVVLSLVNGVVKATGTASITVSALGVSVNFGSAAVEIASNGNVSVSASKTIKVLGVSHTVSISYENGSIKVHY